MMFIFIFYKSLCELIGARSTVSALYAGQERYHFVNISSYGKFCYALSIADTPAYKLDRRYLVILDIEKYFSRASSVCFVPFHKFLYLRRNYKVQAFTL